MCNRNAPPRRVLEPAALVRLIGLVLADHTPNAQEDAHEYLRMLLDKVQSQMPTEKGLKTIFGGTLHSQTICTGCGGHSPKPEAFHDLSLEIGAGATSVSDCLEHYSADEELVGENQYRCEPCGTLKDARKRLRVHAPPQVLVLHLKRFGFDARTGWGTKLEAHVAFEERLELAPYCTEAYLDWGGASDYELYAVIVHEGARVRVGH
jgi:ubiquitin C-terminal hydrolase